MDVSIRVPALEKLVDYVASGIGSTAGHLFAGRIARREVEARLIATEGEVQAQRILAEGQATTMQIIAKAQADARSTLVSPYAVVQGEVALGGLITQRIQFQEEKRQANIGSVVRQAALELGDREVQNHEVDHDWTARFFNDVQDVSSEEMQKLWAKVLAGEVERPENTSIKTLGILKNLDKATASLFRRLCSACVSIKSGENSFLDARVPYLGINREGNALREYGLAYGKLNVLNEHGVIISDYNSWFDYNVCVEPWPSKAEKDMQFIPFSFQSKYWVLSPTTERDPGKEFRLSGVALTRSGWELSRVVGLEPMVMYGQALVKFFEEDQLRMKEVADWRPLTIGSLS